MAFGGDFKPSDKYLIMSREFYKELKEDLARVRTSISVEDAHNSVDYVMQKLRDKFEPAKYNVGQVLLAHEQEFVKPNAKFELTELNQGDK